MFVGNSNAAKVTPACIKIIQSSQLEINRPLLALTKTMMDAASTLQSAGEEREVNSLFTMALVLRLTDSVSHLVTLVYLRGIVDKRNLTSDEINTFINAELDNFAVILSATIKNASSNLLQIKNNGFRDEHRALRDKLAAIEVSISSCY